MKTIDLDSWEAFEGELKEMSTRKLDASDKHPYVSPFLFRGQGNSSWKLKTTLERFTGDNLSLEKYYGVISNAQHQIEAFSGKEWPIPTYPVYLEWLKKESRLSLRNLPAYEYMIYLRHNGFPSPLLDWTQSKYIAAYFAFNKINNNVKNVSIFVYQEYPGGGKLVYGEELYITNLGHYVRSHQRHFLQRSEYTICTEGHLSTSHYADHERVFSKGDQGQDLLWKFNLPAKERIKVLGQLDSYNLNAFSLFGSPESLMETVAFRAFYLEDNF